MELDTTRLRSFLHVAELGTVAAAASALGFTAPAVSQHVAKLEGQVGVPLFERVGGRLSLSVHGRRLVPIVVRRVLRGRVHAHIQHRGGRRGTVPDARDLMYATLYTKIHPMNDVRPARPGTPPSVRPARSRGIVQGRRTAVPRTPTASPTRKGTPWTP